MKLCKNKNADQMTGIFHAKYMHTDSEAFA